MSEEKIKRVATKVRMIKDHKFTDKSTNQAKRVSLKAGDIYEGEKISSFVEIGVAEFVYDEKPKAEKREKKVVKPTEKKKTAKKLEK